MSDETQDIPADQQPTPPRPNPPLAIDPPLVPSTQPVPHIVRVWSVDDLLGAEGEPEIIYYNPKDREGRGVFDDLPTEEKPGFAFDQMDAGTLRNYRQKYAGKVGKKGNPREAQLFLAKHKFLRLVNMDCKFVEKGYDSELDWFMRSPRGQFALEIVMPEYISRQIPDADEGNG